MQTHQKLADRFHPDTAFERKRIERGHDETDEPLTAFWRFPGYPLKAGHSVTQGLQAFEAGAAGDGLSGTFSHDGRLPTVPP